MILKKFIGKKAAVERRIKINTNKGPWSIFFNVLKIKTCVRFPLLFGQECLQSTTFNCNELSRKSSTIKKMINEENFFFVSSFVARRLQYFTIVLA